MDRVIATIIGIVVAVGASAIVFIGINKLFDLAPTRWKIFSALAGGLSAFVGFLLLAGNRLIMMDELFTFSLFGKEIPVDQRWIVTIVATVLGAAAGFILAGISDEKVRGIVGVATGVLFGALVGFTLLPEYRAGFDILALIVWTAIFLAIGVGTMYARRRPEHIVRAALFWGGLGWLVGTMIAPSLGGGSLGWTVAAAVIGGAILGAWAGYRPRPTPVEAGELAIASRKYIFLTPALAFILMALVIPLIRTIWLSLLTGTPTKLTFTGLDNYQGILTDPTIINFDKFFDMFTSRLFWVGIVVFAIGIAVARYTGARQGQRISINGGSLTALATGVILLGFGLFAVVRGTIPNNLWWIFTVTIFATGAGLAIAVLTDRSKGESVAKSFIFMPMAISFVGASIIWRFMYIARPPQKDQTGVMNAIWVKIGEWSNSSTATTVIVIILSLITLGILYIAFTGVKAKHPSVVAGAVVAALPFIWMIFRFLTSGLGGFEIVNDQVVAKPILFLTESPFNNFWMMVVFIWIQTGFAMVIFSAAIKGVPADLLEAASIDGATESQIFWRITVPSIAPTIGVVVTTLIVTILKVFDIPKVMTNGNFDTQVLANEMWQRAFTELDFGVGSALAVLLFLGVLPIMWLNIRRMQQGRA